MPNTSKPSIGTDVVLAAHSVLAAAAFFDFQDSLPGCKSLFSGMLFTACLQLHDRLMPISARFAYQRSAIIVLPTTPASCKPNTPPTNQ